MRDELCHLTRNHYSCLAGILAHKDLPVKEIAKMLLHHSNNFAQCLEGLIIEDERRGAKLDKPDERP